MSNFGLPNKPGDINPNLPQSQVPWVYGQLQKLQAKRIKLSSIQIKNPGTISNQATATGTVQAGSTLFVIDTLTPQPPHGTEMNFAIPYVAVYQGTSANAANLIYPGMGSNISYGSWTINSDFDFFNFSNTNPGSVTSVYNTIVHNNMGVAGTFFYISIWKYLNLNNGTVI